MWLKLAAHIFHVTTFGWQQFFSSFSHINSSIASWSGNSDNFIVLFLKKKQMKFEEIWLICFDFD